MESMGPLEVGKNSITMDSIDTEVFVNPPDFEKEERVNDTPLDQNEMIVT